MMKIYNKIKLILFSTIFVVTALPNITNAANKTVATFVNGITDIVNMATATTLSFIILLFFYHTSRRLFNDSNGNIHSKKEIKETLFWGIIIILVAVSLWGIINLLSGELGLMKNSTLIH